MSHKEILEKAIQEAIDSGWDSFDCTEWWKVYYMYGHDRLAVEFRPATDAMGLFYEWPVIVFNHDFAKALWGDGNAWFTEGQSGDTLPSGNYINYKGHLANMAVADDAIAYLGQNI